MVHIQKIELENFKSYHGLKEIGPFNKDFSCIIGPNGSGKSNVIDAIQFVFGKRGSSLRTNNIGELVHNPTDSAIKKPNFARVIIHFSDDENETKFTISRQVKIHTSKNNKLTSQSQYYHNQDEISFKGMVDLLTSKGIDLMHNRFLILQGEVEAISLMKPLEYLSYIESIIGTDKYIEPIEQALNSYENKQTERELAFNRVNHAEEELDSLEGSKNEVVGFIQKRMEGDEMKFQLGRHTLEKAQLKQRELNNTLNTLHQQTEQIAGQLENVEPRIATAENTLENHNQHRKELELQQELKQKEIDNLESEKIRKTKELAHLHSKLNNVQKQNLPQLIENLKEEIQQNKSKVSSLEETIERHALQTDAMEEKVQQSISKDADFIKPIEESIESFQRQLKPFKGELQEIENQLEIKEKQLQLHDKEKQLQSKNMQKYQYRKKIIESDLETKKNEQTHLDESISQMKSNLQQLDSQSTQLDQEYVEATKVYQREHLKSTHLQSQKQSQSQVNTIYKEMMELKKNDPTLTICNRLGNCATIDKKYNQAISTACRHLDYIVMETTAGAKSCVTFLKEKKIGVGKFLCLDHLQKLFTEKVISKRVSQLPPGAVRLFDLLQFKNDKYKAAFYFALGDTLVSDSIEKAKNLAYGQQKRWRVVTLDGVLIETSGIMCGGGGKKSRGKSMSIDFIDDQTLKMQEQAMKEACEKKNDLKKQYDRIHLTKKSIQGEQQRLLMKREKLELNIRSLTHQYNEFSLQPESNGLLDKMEDQPQMIEEIQQLKTKLSQVRFKVKPFELEIEKLQQQLDDHSSEELRASRISLKTHLAKIKEFKQEKNSTEVLIEKLTKKIGNLEQKAVKQKEQTQYIKETIKKEEANLQTIEAKFKDVSLNAITQELLTVKEQESLLLMELNKLRDSHSHIRTQLEQFQIQIKTQNSVLNKVERQMASIQAELDQLVERLSRDFHLITYPLKALSSLNDKMVDDEDDHVDEKTGIDDKMIDDNLKGPPSFEEEKREEVYPNPYDHLNPITDESIGSLKVNLSVIDYELGRIQPNMKSLYEYSFKEQIYKKLLGKLKDISQARASAQQKYQSLRRQRLDEFMKGFKLICQELASIYSLLTMGGDASLDLVDHLDPFSKGILFSVKPCNKSWKNIAHLSGGEKTLSSLSLIFALHHYAPTPVYVMDEIDAALDIRNVSIVAHYIKHLCSSNAAQFIVISLRNSMFELADQLIGIYKVSDQTSSVALLPKTVIEAKPINLIKS